MVVCRSHSVHQHLQHSATVSARLRDGLQLIELSTSTAHGVFVTSMHVFSTYSATFSTRGRPACESMVRVMPGSQAAPSSVAPPAAVPRTSGDTPWCPDGVWPPGRRQRSDQHRSTRRRRRNGESSAHCSRRLPMKRAQSRRSRCRSVPGPTSPCVRAADRGAAPCEAFARCSDIANQQADPRHASVGRPRTSRRFPRCGWAAAAGPLPRGLGRQVPVRTESRPTHPALSSALSSTHPAVHAKARWSLVRPCNGYPRIAVPGPIGSHLPLAVPLVLHDSRVLNAPLSRPDATPETSGRVIGPGMTIGGSARSHTAADASVTSSICHSVVVTAPGRRMTRSR